MAEFPAFPLWTDAYLGDTTHLTTIEHGAYLLLLISMWRTKEKCLPDDDKMLARYARLTPAQWRRIKPILEPFFNVKSNTWTQGRLTDEANAVKRHSKKQSDKAKARWLKDKETPNAVGVPDECRDDASLTLTLTHSVANATGPFGPEALDEKLFGPCLEWLQGKGIAERQARSLLGKWRSRHGSDEALRAVRSAYAAGASDPVAFIEKILGGGREPRVNVSEVLGIAK